MGGESVSGGACRKKIRRIGREMCRSVDNTSHETNFLEEERERGGEGKGRGGEIRDWAFCIGIFFGLRESGSRNGD